jgi:hypothetical protein
MGLFSVVVDVASFWHQKLLNWYSSRNPVELWLEQLRTAEAFEDWEEAALHLDNLLGLDLWCDLLPLEAASHSSLTIENQEKQPNIQILRLEAHY